jgi:hypothetical protein
MYEIFISYSPQDEATAASVYQALKGQGFSCCTTARNIQAAANSITIVGSRLIVVVLSSSTNSSRQVSEEVALAFNRRVPILFYCIEEIDPCDVIGDFLSGFPRVDAFTPPMERHLEHLTDLVTKLLDPTRDEHQSKISAAAKRFFNPMPLPQGKPLPPKAQPATAQMPSAAGRPARSVENQPTADATAALVFISAKSEDYEHAGKVYRFLVKSGVRVFFSHESLPQLGNSDYGAEIDRALDEARHMIVVTSSVEHVTSSWVKEEWMTFISEKRSGRKCGNLVTVVIGTIDPGALPISLRRYEVIRLEENALERLLRYVSG